MGERLGGPRGGPSWGRALVGAESWGWAGPTGGPSPERGGWLLDGVMGEGRAEGPGVPSGTLTDPTGRQPHFKILDVHTL